MDVTYYVALPFVIADDGVAAGEAVECLSANAAVMRAEALSRSQALGASRSAERGSGDRRIRRRQADPEIRRRTGRPERAVKPDYPSSECSRKKRSISLVASGPRGSV